MKEQKRVKLKSAVKHKKIEGCETLGNDIILRAPCFGEDTVTFSVVHDVHYDGDRDDEAHFASAGDPGYHKVRRRDYSAFRDLTDRDVAGHDLVNAKFRERRDDEGYSGHDDNCWRGDY